MTLTLCGTIFEYMKIWLQGHDTNHVLDLDDIDPYSNWIDKDVDPIFTTYEIIDLKRDETKWQANVATYEDSEGEFGEPSEAGLLHTHLGQGPMPKAPIEDTTATQSTSKTPTQWQQTLLRFSHRNNLLFVTFVDIET